jgi:prepilin signal peptidase PulO-like enzyme (type II secretory pathway)
VSGALVPFTTRALYILYARRRPARSSLERQPELSVDREEDDRRREGMGLGDVKMLAMVGAFLGMPGVLLTMFLGSVIGTLVVVPMVLAGRQGMKSPVPFGPFLGLAAWISMFWGGEIIDWYLGLAIPWT